MPLWSLLAEGSGGVTYVACLVSGRPVGGGSIPDGRVGAKELYTTAECTVLCRSVL